MNGLGLGKHWRIGLLGCLLFLPVTLWAESAFVIDRVEAGLHESADPASPIIKTVATGTTLEVLARDGNHVRVRDEAGTEGWIDAQFLMPAKPTRQLLTEAEAEIERLRAELEQLRNRQGDGADASAPSAELDRLKQVRNRLQAELSDERDRVAALRTRLGELESRPAAANGRRASRFEAFMSEPRYVAGMAVVLLLLGVATGIWLMDYLNRRRHGGFRI